MRVGIVVDGQAEFHGLRCFLPRLGLPHPVAPVLYCDIQPLATPAQMARAACSRARILAAREVDTIVVLIDKETRQECAGELALAVQREAQTFLAELALQAEVRVVLKVSTFENWLVADPQALRELPGRFENVERIERKVAPGRADAVDALALLKACSRQRHFHKTGDGSAICRKLDPLRAAGNSRSFRKLLKELGHPDFTGSTRLPATVGQRSGRRRR